MGKITDAQWLVDRLLAMNPDDQPLWFYTIYRDDVSGVENCGMTVYRLYELGARTACLDPQFLLYCLYGNSFTDSN